MICLAFPHSRFNIPVIIFYTCIWLPFCQLKETILHMIQAFFGKMHPDRSSGAAPCEFESLLDGKHSISDLPVAKYEELSGAYGPVDGLCSVCLTEFEAAAEVNRLPVCGHDFHVPCITRWLDRDRFSCPLCRSNIFRVAWPVRD